MTCKEFSDEFDTLVSSYASANPRIVPPLAFDEYEKSMFLTIAQEETLIAIYNGKNPSTSLESFETSEEVSRYLNNSVRTKEYTSNDSQQGVGLTDTSLFFQLPSDCAFITLEQAFINTGGKCSNPVVRVNVYPITHDEYATVKDNPFRGATRQKVLRLNYGELSDVVEIISKYPVEKYLIKYLKKPTPIVLIDLTDSGLSINGVQVQTECELNPLIHKTILSRAVQLAIASKAVAGTQQK